MEAHVCTHTGKNPCTCDMWDVQFTYVYPTIQIEGNVNLKVPYYSHLFLKLNLGNIQRYTLITLYPTLPLYYNNNI